jgi:hypothetical protein
LNASLIFKPWQFWALWLILRCNTWRNLRSSPLLNYDAADTIPIKLDVSGEVNLHLYHAVSVLREKAQGRVPSHQFACSREDDRNA